VITTGSAAAGRFRNAVEAARDAWTKTGLLSISKVSRLREARTLAKSAEPVALSKLLVDMAGPIRQVRIADALSARMAQHQKLMELVVRAALKSEIHQCSKEGGSMDFTRVQRRLESWIESGRWSPLGSAAEDIGASRGSDMAAICADGMKPADAVVVRLTLVAPLAPALEHLRLALSVPESVLDSMEASQRTAKEANDAADKADADKTEAGKADFADTVAEVPSGFADTAPADVFNVGVAADGEPKSDGLAAARPRTNG
jgi:hypothetical protein